MIRRLLIDITILTSLLAFAGPVSAQLDLPLDEGVAGLHQTLRALQTNASILHVVAHPDDEDGPLMCYCARGLGARVILFSITRGEGGANLISRHFFDELGALRTLEHVKAAQYYGNDLFYSSAADYGYSKNLAEANRTWNNGQRILGELVEVIRREQPTVIMSRFRGDPRDGHGHHQMAGVLSRKAFRAAANPAQFPEQLKRGLQTWQPYKLYVNSRPEWHADDRNNWTVAVPTGQYDPVLGRSYGQVARFGLGFQRSQGISGHIGEAGERNSYYRLQAVAEGVTLPKSESLPIDNLDLTVSATGKLPGMEVPIRFAEQANRLEQLISSAVDSFAIDAPQQIVEPLAKALSQVQSIRRELRSFDLSKLQRSLAENQLRRKEQQLHRAIGLAAGIQLDAWVETTGPKNRGPLFLSPGQEITAKASLVVRNDVPANLKAVQWRTKNRSWQNADTKKDASTNGKPLTRNKPTIRETAMTVPPDVSLTRPYWSRTSIRQPFYDVSEGNRQAPMPEPPLACTATLEIHGADIQLHRVAETRVRDPLFGNVRYPIQIVPPVSVAFPLREGVLPKNRTIYDVDVAVRSFQDTKVAGTVRVNASEGWSIEPEQYALSGPRSEGDELQFQFALSRTSPNAVDPCRLEAVVEWNGQKYSEGVTTVTARDLDRINLYRPAVHIVRTVEATVLGDPEVGYITGSGDDVAQSLAMLGIRPVMLTSDDLAAANLNEYDVILVGVRAYAVRKDLRKYNSRLIEFVKTGGALIVQYQTPEFDDNFGPYPYSMGRRPEEVSEEDAVVKILEPNHPLLNRPNKIEAADFDGWLEQRGSKFLTTWSKEYLPLLECHDTGQQPQQGGLLVARHGNGVYVYSAYAWYRQLPNGVPGAFRLMANHLSLPQTLSLPDTQSTPDTHSTPDTQSLPEPAGDK